MQTLRDALKSLNKKLMCQLTNKVGVTFIAVKCNSSIHIYTQAIKEHNCLAVKSFNVASRLSINHRVT